MAEKFGPVNLAEGVQPRHVAAYLFAAFVSIGLFIYLIAMTPYILRVNVGLDEARFGQVSGDLQFWQELLVIMSIGWWGAMSDRYGRRRIYIIGFLVLTVAYATYAFSTSVPELIATRLVFAFGVAATSALLAAVLADYPAEDSRGKLSGMAFFLNGIGSVIFITQLTKLPAIFEAQGTSGIMAGRFSYLVVAAVAFVAAIVMLGLKPGKPVKVEDRKPVSKLMLEGLAAARNPRIAISYLSSVAARADMAVVTIFLILWVSQAATAAGLSVAEATAKAGMLMGFSQIAAVFWAPLFGFIADKIDRLTLVVIAFTIAAFGYGGVAMQEDILATGAIPYIVLMGVGMSSTILAVTVLLGQEAPPKLRGSAFGMQSFFGACGILALSAIGGRLYDGVSANAVFYMIAGANLFVLLAALLVRVSELRTGTRG
ncbi:MAG: MFS transporter [Gammaproteobacteria bacterium]|nr:MFS transporter [Gammaproteobacteria bacterium]